jgi:nicotinate dehydrogenase subunit B
MTHAPTRRAMLKAGGSLVVSFALMESLPQNASADAASEAAASARVKTVAPDQVDAYVAINGDGSVTIYSGKVDLGTGIRTAMTQIAADELDLPLSRVTVIEGDTLLTPDQGPTYGSLSIQNGGMQLRKAAATARRHLVALGASKLNVPEANLIVEDGIVRPKAGGKGVSYGELIGGGNFALTFDKDAPTKDPALFRFVGRPIVRLDIPAKATGRFTYMHDVKVDGILHGRVVRPPAMGAELRSVDEASVKDIPGLVRVVREGNFVGVVAESEWGAIRAAKALKATWSDWQGLPAQDELWEHVRATKVAKDDTTSTVGNVDEALPKGAKHLSATYEFPIHTHGSIGPSCAIAEFQDGKLLVWTSSQMTHALRKELAAMLNMTPENVRCIYVEGSGCYGRNGHEDAAADAVLLSRAAGKPVRVQWSRQDEHGWDPKGPPTLIDLRAALDEDGRVTAWDSEFFIPDGAAGNVPLIAASLAGLPDDAKMSPGNIIQNSALPYNFPNIRTVCHRLTSTPLRPSWIRTPGRMQNTYANESFMDELAATAGVDPFEFRLRYLNDPRGIDVLHRLAALSKWQPRPSPAKASSSKDEVMPGRGMAYVKYELYRTYVGAVAEVAVNRTTGEIKVPRVYVAHDCGQIINPNGLRNQVDGNVIQTVSRVLKEELTFDKSAVTSLDWASYPIITFPDVPEVIVELIDRPTEKPWGGGEPSAAVIPAAISNAIFDATGVRMRSIPYRPERVKRVLNTAI